MYAMTIEYDKHLIHKIIVYLNNEALSEFNKINGSEFTLPDASLCINDWKLQFLRKIKNTIKIIHHVKNILTGYNT